MKELLSSADTLAQVENNDGDPSSGASTELAGLGNLTSQAGVGHGTDRAAAVDLLYSCCGVRTNKTKKAS
jgi:hypothetical protein